jgi:hypothetical protein
MKIQYKNTFNQTNIRICQNLMFKNNNNIIFCQFKNILYFEIFKFRFWVWVVSKNRSLVWFGFQFFVLSLVRFGLRLENFVSLVLKIEN